MTPVKVQFLICCLNCNFFLQESMLFCRLRPGSDAVLFMSRTQFEFGPTQIDKSTPLDSDAVLFGRS